MLEQIDPFYYFETSLIFQMIQTAVRPLSPIAMSFSGDDQEDAFSKMYSMTPVEVIERHGQVGKRLKARTAGLVEISQSKDNPGLELDDGSSKAYARRLLEMEVQYLHLTVKEFFRSSNVPAWLATRISQVDAGVHLKISACSLRHLYVAQSLDYDFTDYVSGYRGHMGHALYSVPAMVLFHAREVERATKKSQLPFFEALGEILSNVDETWEPEGMFHRVPKGGRGWHWTLGRYDDWGEPQGWLSDHVSYLAAIGMTSSVIDILDDGYNPTKKPGRPLLLYATCCVAPDYAIRDLERDTIDPLLVGELLQRGCDPNQPFVSKGAAHIRRTGARTVWEAVLHQISQRFDGTWANTEAAANYEAALEQDQKAMHSLKLRWLETIKLFLEHGANPAQCIIVHERRPRGQTTALRRSGLLIFNRVFSDFNHPLVKLVRDLMVRGGGKRIEEPWSDSGEENSSILSSTRFHLGRLSDRGLNHYSQLLGRLERRLEKWRKK
jgi:hypothetical protein